MRPPRKLSAALTDSPETRARGSASRTVAVSLALLSVAVLSGSDSVTVVRSLSLTRTVSLAADCAGV